MPLRLEDPRLLAARVELPLRLLLKAEPELRSEVEARLDPEPVRELDPVSRELAAPRSRVVEVPRSPAPMSR